MHSETLYKSMLHHGNNNVGDTGSNNIYGTDDQVANSDQRELETAMILVGESLVVRRRVTGVVVGWGCCGVGFLGGGRGRE